MILDNDEEVDAILKKVKKPMLNFSAMQKILDDKARKIGYEDNHDLLLKTGWLNRFDINTN